MDYLSAIVRYCMCVVVLTFMAKEGAGVQRFLQQPEDVKTIQGQTVILRCTVEKLEGTVLWMRDGFGLGDMEYYERYSIIGAQERGEYHLMISNVHMEDDAQYDCQVIATATSAAMRSRKANVTVLYPCQQPVVEGALPMSGTSRKRVEVVADTPTNLTCSAPNGRPAANITWYMEGAPIEGETYSFISKRDKMENATVSLNVTAQRHEKPLYECHAQNAAMRLPLVERIELDVLYAPIVSIMVEPMREARESGTVTFTCSATANPNTLTWKWFIGDTAISGATSHVYKLYSVGREHHGKRITCEASNKVGSTKTGHLLNVHYSPRFKSSPAHPAVDLGDDATLTCEVDSNPNAAILWRRKDDPTRKILSSDKTLVIRQVSPAQLGVYTCSVTLLDFNEIVAEVHVLQKGPPLMLSSSEQSGKFGSLGEVECSVRLVPVAKIVWSRDKKPLDLSVLERYQRREEVFPGGVRSVLEINSVQDSDYSEYNCSVDNGYGTAHLLINFSKRAVIPIAYILAGALIGVVLIIVVTVIAYVYHRRRTSAREGEDSSQGSDDSVAKKPVTDLTSSPFKTPYVDTWNTDQKYFRNSADYDELSYPARDGRRSANPYDTDYNDAYGNYGYDRDYRRDYGTYPGPAIIPPRPFETRYEPGPYGPISHPGDFGPYPRAPSRQSYGPLPPVAAPLAPPPSRLSTNV